MGEQNVAMRQSDWGLRQAQRNVIFPNAPTHTETITEPSVADVPSIEITVVEPSPCSIAVTVVCKRFSPVRPLSIHQRKRWLHKATIA